MRAIHRCIARLALALAGAAAHAAPAALPATLSATLGDPRAFGYFVGDVVTRQIDVTVPAPLTLVDDSLPRAGRQGRALELRKVEWKPAPFWRPGHASLTLEYQAFLAPREVRTLEMPPITLRFAGGPRELSLRIDAWPVTVAPLVPLEVSPRHGLGEMRPDAPPPLIDVRAATWRLGAYAAVAVLLLGYLAHVYVALPWLARRARPFGQAWGTVRGVGANATPEQLRSAMQAVHHALNRTAGTVLFENGVLRFIDEHPAFAPLRADLEDFFDRSRALFFGGAGDAAADAPRLVSLCRRARDLERGAA